MIVPKDLHKNLQVVRSLVATAGQFRVLALSATPGGDVQVNYCD